MYQAVQQQSSQNIWFKSSRECRYLNVPIFTEIENLCGKNNTYPWKGFEAYKDIFLNILIEANSIIIHQNVRKIFVEMYQAVQLQSSQKV